MLILILIDVQYSQKTVFSFEEGSNCQNHSSLGSLHLVKKSPARVKFPIPPTPYHYLENTGGNTSFINWMKQEQITTFCHFYLAFSVIGTSDRY